MDNRIIFLTLKAVLLCIINASCTNNTERDKLNQLCEVVGFLDEQEFTGDFYVYDPIKFGPYVDSIYIPDKLVKLLSEAEIEYVMRTNDAIDFGSIPKNTKGEYGFRLSSSKSEQVLDLANSKMYLDKIDDMQCGNMQWYTYQIK